MCESSWGRSWCASARDHGGVRGRDSARARSGADRVVPVPQILEFIVEVMPRSRSWPPATDHGGNHEGVQGSSGQVFQPSIIKNSW